MPSLIFNLICVLLHLLSNIECWICVSQNYHCEQWYWCGWVGFIMVTILSDYLAMMVCRISPISYWLNTAHDNLSVPNCQAPSPLGVPKCVLYGPTYSNLSGTTLAWLCLHTGAIKWSIYWTSRVCHPSTYQITCGRVVAGTHWTGINAEPGRGRITSIVFLKFWFEAILH